MERCELKHGTPVWAQIGGYGFRMAKVNDSRNRWRKLVPLRFYKNGIFVGFGKRQPSQLFPRNPLLGNKDKPRIKKWKSKKDD